VNSDNVKRYSAFNENGFKDTIEKLKEEIREVFLLDEVPWVIGYSGGKDSTAILQLVWLAISELPEALLKKEVHVISTDTLVENPIVATWVNKSLNKIKIAADEQNLPIIPHRLTPKIENSFWVNLIGKGYPAPRNKFRWCTERLKIRPSSDFIREMVANNGETILVLGSRRGESAKRSANFQKRDDKLKQQGMTAVREKLKINESLSANSLVYTPIEDWTNDDVWTFLLQTDNCWGNDHNELLALYRGATADGECPLVVDKSTPSCGNSRFGCWVCTLVDQDKSMSAMIQNDEEKEWMLPLLEFRNELDFRTTEERRLERSRRDFRRIDGRLTYYQNVVGEDSLVHGPYKQEARAYFLKRLLEVQKLIQEEGPSEVKDYDFITFEELEEIRRIWLQEKRESEDLVPQIFVDVFNKKYPGKSMDEYKLFDGETLKILKQICGDSDMHYELVRSLLDVERSYRTKSKRRGLFDAIQKTLRKSFYSDEKDALHRAKALKAVKAIDIEILQSDELLEKASDMVASYGKSNESEKSQ
jgi:DNA sulfur modification protein DndC